MKRFGLTLVAAFCLAATTFAAGNQPTTEKKWEGSINVNTLSKYLKLTQSQHEKWQTFANISKADDIGQRSSRRSG